MTEYVEWRVVSDTDGYVTECTTEAAADEVADNLNVEDGLPNDHAVKKHVEYL